jgi:hypothetical protein
LRRLLISTVTGVSAPHAKTELTEMTAYDAARLRAFHSINPEEYLAAQRGEIGSRMIRELTAATDGAAAR